MDMIVLYSIIRPHIVQQTRSRIVKKYVEEVLPSIKNSSVDSAYLMNKFSLSRSDISELVREDLLVMRDVGSYWLSFPRCGQFVKAYNCGRKEILKIIKKSKFSEVLQMELEKKKLSKKASLGMSLHILDVIGSEAVQCKPTVSGMMLRYGP
ncbi:UNVERIFIED_CONTAM: hypothetical protein PYX00_008208 [Menopon gallinae]|uniref:Uncharacterized protein n=1 Tax=Menopon gallinae TaxID=328185 RepID=A0AAW2HMC0_9NEOP